MLLQEGGKGGHGHLSFPFGHSIDPSQFRNVSSDPQFENRVVERDESPVNIYQFFFQQGLLDALDVGGTLQPVFPDDIFPAESRIDTIATAFKKFSCSSVNPSISLWKKTLFCSNSSSIDWSIISFVVTGFALYQTIHINPYMKKKALDPMATEAFGEKAYRAALEEVERLLPLVGEETPADDPAALALAQASDIVIEYEKRHHPIAAASITSQEELDAMRTKLSHFFAERAQRAIDERWDEGIFDQRKLDELRGQHLRTPLIED